MTNDATRSEAGDWMSLSRPVLRWLSAPAVAVIAVTLLAAPVLASKVASFRAAKSADFLAGTLDGVSVGPLGKLRLASALEQVTTVTEPFLLSAAADGHGGWVVGTGNSGKVFRISSDGTAAELFATDEPEVFAVWVEGDTVYAGGSPNARIYRYVMGTEATSETATAAGAEMIFDTEEQYAWAMAREPSTQGQGRLLVATGIHGKLLALDEATGEHTTVYDTDDAHLRTLLVRDREVFVGTVGEGRILQLDPSAGESWSARTLYDAAQPEITSLTQGPDGSIFAAAVASEASLAQLPAPSSTNGADESAKPAAPAAGTRPAGFEGARSLVVEVAADGSVETRGSFKKETVYSVLWLPKPASDGSAATGSTAGDLWIGTGQEGKLYRSRGKEVVLERDLAELQLMQLLPHPLGLSIATTNGAAVYRTSEAQLTRGVFTSKVLDTKFPSRFGTLHFESVLPQGSEVRFAVRSGLSAFPDDTWADWVEVGRGVGGPRDPEVIPDLSLSDVPRGRYVQWRATLVKDDASRRRAATDEGPELSVVELSYAQENRPPEITELEVLAPGVVLVNGSFNPSNQVFEPTSPNRDGIFNSLDKPAEDTSARAKELWKLGYRTVKWKASDPNKDELRYTVALSPEGEERWYVVAEEISKTSWGFDSTVLPDGLYRVRVSAHDGTANATGQERTAQRTSGLVVIDHTAPQVRVQPARSGSTEDRRTVTVVDALSPVRKVELSVNAAEWQELQPADGMMDARSETLTVDLAALIQGAGEDAESPPLVLLRVQDAAFNATVLQVQF